MVINVCQMCYGSSTATSWELAYVCACARRDLKLGRKIKWSKKFHR